MNAEAEKIIARLGLAPLPREGGFFRQTWMSRERLSNGRAAGSAILFLITTGDFSALHRLATDELWHFCSGDAVEHVQLDPRDTAARITRLGPDAVTDAAQLVVRGGIWQAARLSGDLSPSQGGKRPPAHGWALLACTMSPAWEESEFTLGQRAELSRAFPAQTGLISSLTR